MKHIILILVVSIFKYLASSDYVSIDCQDEILNKSSCTCNMLEYDYYNEVILIIECNDFLHSASIKLPNISAYGVKVISTFTQWPYIPRNYMDYTVYFDFSKNQIDAVGDLSNCPNLEKLNLSNNFLTEIPKNLAQTPKLTILDLTSNSIEIVDMKLFVSGFNSSTNNLTSQLYLSQLQYLYLAENNIKLINSLDLFIFGLPFLVRLDLSLNKIRELNLGSISQYSKSLNKMVKEKFNSDTIVKKIYTIKSGSYYGYFFASNDIEVLNLGFRGIYEALTEVNANISIDYLYVRFTSVLLVYNNLKCSCGLFEDLNFVINGPLNKSKFFEYFPLSSIAPTQCQLITNKNINFSIDLKMKKIKRSEFCNASNSLASMFSFSLYLNLCIFLMNYNLY